MSQSDCSFRRVCLVRLFGMSGAHVYFLRRVKRSLLGFVLSVALVQ